MTFLRQVLVTKAVADAWEATLQKTDAKRAEVSNVKKQTTITTFFK